MSDCCKNDCNNCNCKKHAVLIPIFLLVLIGVVYLGILSRNALRQYEYIGKNPDQVNTMMFSGEGKVESKPDIAKISMGLMVEKKNISEAQKESTDVMNQFVAKVKEMGVEAKDIKTENYSINPQYDWSKEGKQSLRGYQISQNINLKIRNLDKVGDILALAGEFNLNQVGSLEFDIDQKDDLIKKARQEAIAKAKDKAEETAKDLGISLGKVISFSENNEMPPQIYNGGRMYSMKSMDTAEAVAPQISEGSAELKVNVNISYEIR